MRRMEPLISTPCILPLRSGLKLEVTSAIFSFSSGMLSSTCDLISACPSQFQVND
eukprot:COSAG04_NODE_1167_length_7984_cov_8.922384_2_plen_55_part_00